MNNVLRDRLVGMTSAAGFLALLGTLAGFAAGWHWLLDLCSHFRVQAALGLVLSAAVTGLAGHRRTAAAHGLGAALNLACILPFWLPAEPPAANDRPVHRAMLMNVNTRGGDPVRVAAAVREFEPQVLVLEEISAAWLSALEAADPAFFGGTNRLVETREDNFGIGLFSRFPLRAGRVVEAAETGLPSLLADVHLPEGIITVIATHPPPPFGAEYSGWRNAQLAELPALVLAAAHPVLLIGDLNTSPWSPHFRRLVRDSGLRDSMRGHGVQASWPTNTRLLRIPIDHALLSPGLTVRDRRIGPDVGSDHFPLVLDFSLSVPGPD
jgi:endonuclease/exonuclease/phosphatase (EEP) superfamily protein YafD